ncbi:MAG: hypothetical protein V1909_06670 [Candidatus Micrarchaeota archaeon]
MGKKYFRCIVCNDIHYGSNPPEICPTCFQFNKFEEIGFEEAKKILEL